MPGGAIIVVMTRWSKLDLTGQIMDQMTKNDEAEPWEIVEFPAILTDKKGTRTRIMAGILGTRGITTET